MVLSCAVNVHAGAPLGFIQDHSTYMGINVDNANCLVDQSVLQLGRESSLPWCALVPAA
jgi:hypothetical protein